jgi:hypothetical protein
MNWFTPSKTDTKPSDSQMSFILADETSFYHRFERDLLEATKEVVIESPFITVAKLRSLKAIFESLISRGVKVFVITRHPEEHDALMAEQSEAGIRFFEKIGVQVLMCHDHHRKIAMVDRRIIWKGSLNILSHRNTREFMEREENEQKAEILFKFLKYNQVSEITSHLLY